MERTELGRIMAFTDGVMAVAITLLVLNVEVPRGPAGDLDERLVDLLPSLAAYALSFALVGRFWVIHHNLFERLRAFDGRLMALNLVFLALIALMPFASDLVDEYSREPLAAAVFGLVLGLAALVNWLMRAHTLHAGLIRDEHRDEVATFASPLSLGFTLVFLLSVPVAFLSVTAAQLLWVSTIVLRYPLRRLGARLGATSS